MKAKRFIVLSIAAVAALSLVGCGYDQKTGGVDEIADITDNDYLVLSTQPIWCGTVKEVLTTDVDATAGYKLQGTNSKGQPITFADIDGVTGITYKYYKKSSTVSIDDINTPSSNQYWDADGIHLKDNIGTKLETDSIKEKGTYFVVMSFSVNENRYKRIPDMVCELQINEPTKITDENFKFTEKRVEFTGDYVSNYATVTLDGEEIILSPDLSQEKLTKLGLKSITYKYTTGENSTWSTTRPMASGSYQVQINFETLDNVQTPKIETNSANIIINNKATTITYVMNNDEAEQISNKVINTNTLTNNELPTLENTDSYEFEGWYADKELTRKADELTSAASDLTLYAKWNQVKFNLTYEENVIYIPEVADKKAVTEITASDLEPLIDPTGKYTFAGWYTDVALKNAAAAGAINANTTLYAKWTLTTSFTGFELYEMFDIKNVESYEQITVNNANVSNENGSLKISYKNNKGYLEYALKNLVYTDKAIVARIQFDIIESVNASKWDSFALYSGDTRIFDNQSDEKDKFGYRPGNNATHIDQNKVAGTKYTYEIDFTLNADGLTYSIRVCDETNKYDLATNVVVSGVNNISSIRFGNVSTADRNVIIDNLMVGGFA